MDKLHLRETKFYKIYVSPLINLLYSTLGNTVGIWGGYIIIKFVFDKLWDNLQWPGIDSFIIDGSILLISFSFLSSSLYYSTRSLKINFFNSISILLLFTNVLFYSRVIAIKQVNNPDLLNDQSVRLISIFTFVISIILLYWILAREKYMENNANMIEERDSEYNKLKGKFSRGK